MCRSDEEEGRRVRSSCLWWDLCVRGDLYQFRITIAVSQRNICFQMIDEAAGAALCYVGNYGLLSLGLEIVLNQHSLAYSVSALVCSIYHQSAPQQSVRFRYSFGDS
jgi:hypothetical protein